MRVFLDDVGMHWEVREIRDSSVEFLPESHTSHPHCASGWLFFSSESERRQVAPYPPNWSTLNAFELSRLCRRATPVRRRQTTSSSSGHSWSKYS